jgi:hypothetical protein
LQLHKAFNAAYSCSCRCYNEAGQALEQQASSYL